jgi:hypothetical protein
MPNAKINTSDNATNETLYLSINQTLSVDRKYQSDNNQSEYRQQLHENISAQAIK